LPLAWGACAYRRTRRHKAVAYIGAEVWPAVCGSAPELTSSKEKT
jgi:hypothetical protein